MYKVIHETEKYKTIKLYETKTIKVLFTECKNDRMYDRIKIIKLGNIYTDAQTIVIYRYEDEQLVENMINIYKEME